MFFTILLGRKFVLLLSKCPDIYNKLIGETWIPAMGVGVWKLSHVSIGV
jgi:hypothetical protein